MIPRLCKKKNNINYSLPIFRIIYYVFSGITKPNLSLKYTLYTSGIRQFGKNFKTIAEILGTKTETNVRKFWVDYKRRYNLDSVLKEYEAEAGPQGEDEVR